LGQTVEPNLHGSTAGLDLDSADSARMMLRGSVSTADMEDDDKVAQVLKARLLETPLPIAWVHPPEIHRHDFTVSAIVRGEQPRALTLAWNGAPLGVKTSDSREIEVPGRNAFTVTSAQAYDDNGNRQVIVQFSEKLASRQDLKGLVRLSQGEFTTQVRGNELRLYVNEQVMGDVVVTLDEGLRSAAGGKLIGEHSFSLSFSST